jgi:hypothetical protein
VQALRGAIPPLGKGQTRGPVMPRGSGGFNLDGGAHSDPSKARRLARANTEQGLSTETAAATSLWRAQAEGLPAAEASDVVQLDTLDVRPLLGVVFKQFTARDRESR